MLFVDRQVFRPAVKLTSAGKDDLYCWITFTAGFQNRQLRPTIDFQVRIGIEHGIHVAGLSGKVEQVVLALNQVVQTMFVPDVGNIDPDFVLQPGNVEEVPSVLWYETIDEDDMRT